MPKKSALLIVDAQVEVLSTLWESARLLGNLQKLVARARSAGVPVVWVQHSDGELQFGSDGWTLAPGLVPAASEPVVHKIYNSSFAQTDLDSQLKSLGVTRVVLAGAATNWCIRATAYAALERGYDLALVGDAHSTESIQVEDGSVVTAEAIVADLNTVMKWIVAPGVRTEVETSADVSL